MINNHAMRSKSDIRSLALKQRQSLSQQQRSLYSQYIMTSLFAYLSAQAIAPQCLLMYRSLPSEVMTDAMLLTQDYDLFAPVVQDDTSMQWLRVGADTVWRKSAFGVLEPLSGLVWNAVSGGTILLCPLTAFDRQGNRLGMGKGCFDRWMVEFRDRVDRVVGLAFSCQEVASLPVEPHDMPMDIVITEKEVIACMS